MGEKLCQFLGVANEISQSSFFWLLPENINIFHDPFSLLAHPTKMLVLDE